MNRRSFLCAAPAIGLAFPSASLAEDTPILKLFRKWDELHWSGYDLTKPDRELDLVYHEQKRIEREMMVSRVQGYADFAAKLVAYTCYGDFEVATDGGHDLIAEAKELIGRFK